MVTVTFIHADESEQKVTGVAGSTVMQLAIDEGVEGIVAECGGGCGRRGRCLCRGVPPPTGRVRRFRHHAACRAQPLVAGRAGIGSFPFLDLARFARVRSGGPATGRWQASARAHLRGPALPREGRVLRGALA